MKALILLITLSFSFLASPGFAQANLSCRAGDHGWEEHFGGHKNCGECLKKHGKCVETCSLSFYTCEARGKDYQGNSIILKGTGDDRFEAERNALRHCQRNFNECSSGSCSTTNEQVSRKECPKQPVASEPRPDRPDRPRL